MLQVVTEGKQASKDSGQTLESVGRSVGWKEDASDCKIH